MYLHAERIEPSPHARISENAPWLALILGITAVEVPTHVCKPLRDAADSSPSHHRAHTRTYGRLQVPQLESLLLQHDLTLPRESIDSGSWNGNASELRAHPFLAPSRLA
jgi:hypothetical protein